MFKAGENVFTLDGREVEYVAAAGNRHLVCSIYETDNGLFTGGEFIADAVFSTPPTERLHAEVRDLESKVAELRKQAWEAQKEAREAEAASADRMKALSKMTGLERLEDFLAGRITHFVETNDYTYGVKVVTFKQAMETEARYDKGLRLICLFGKADGRLSWGVNRYSDGSGLYTDSQPFCSEEEAVARAREIILEKAEEAVAKDRIWNLSETIKCAEIYGVTLKEEHLAAYRSRMREGLEKQVQEAQKKVEEAQASLAKYQ